MPDAPIGLAFFGNDGEHVDLEVDLGCGEGGDYQAGGHRPDVLHVARKHRVHIGPVLVLRHVGRHLADVLHPRADLLQQRLNAPHRVVGLGSGIAFADEVRAVERKAGRPGEVHVLPGPHRFTGPEIHVRQQVSSLGRAFAYADMLFVSRNHGVNVDLEINNRRRQRLYHQAGGAGVHVPQVFRKDRVDLGPEGGVGHISRDFDDVLHLGSGLLEEDLYALHGVLGLGSRITLADESFATQRDACLALQVHDSASLDSSADAVVESPEHLHVARVLYSDPSMGHMTPP